VTVLSSLGDGDAQDLAGLSLDHHVSNEGGRRVRNMH
jgi:hypothetical protein